MTDDSLTREYFSDGEAREIFARRFDRSRATSTCVYAHKSDSSVREIYSGRELSVVRGLYQRETFMKDLRFPTHLPPPPLSFSFSPFSPRRGTRDDDSRSPTRDTSRDLSNNLSNPPDSAPSFLWVRGINYY